MFTGLVREVARIRSLRRQGALTGIEIEAPATVTPVEGAPPAIGDSVAVNGICLTVVRIAGTRLWVEASAETRRVTTLPGWKAGTLVHLEPSLRMGDRVGGHFVLGHVDGTGALAKMERLGGSAAMTVTVPPGLAGRLLPKGSIAVDGVSLTLDEGPFHRGFTVTLIPHTLAATRFTRLAPGTRLNLELDILSKAAEAAEGRRPLTMEALEARGWRR